MNSSLQTIVCTNCVMDTSDPSITFNSQGVCNYCTAFETLSKTKWKPNEEGELTLRARTAEIKIAGRGKPYDCIIGLSGGVDSSYVCIKAVELGLRPLVVHVDGGWNSELAANNIEVLVKKLNLDLHTYVVNWNEMRRLQIAYLKSGVANQDVPQDHAFFAQLLREARQHGIKYVISGSNYATESILPQAWGYDAIDSINLKAIFRRYGSGKLDTYPTVSFFEWYIYYPRIYGIKFFAPLNLLPYNKAEAKRILIKEYGWKDYGGKHYESRFTKFFQGHYLVTRFGYDKRRAHLSSLIVSGQLTRDDAMAELTRPPYPPEDLEEDILFIMKKLGLTMRDFDEIMQAPKRVATEFASQERYLNALKAIRRVLPISAR